MGTQDKVFDAKVMGKQLKILRKKDRKESRRVSRIFESEYRNDIPL